MYSIVSAILSGKLRYLLSQSAMASCVLPNLSQVRPRVQHMTTPPPRVTVSRVNQTNTDTHNHYVKENAREEYSSVRIRFWIFSTVLRHHSWRRKKKLRRSGQRSKYETQKHWMWRPLCPNVSEFSHHDQSKRTSCSSRFNTHTQALHTLAIHTTQNLNTSHENLQQTTTQNSRHIYSTETSLVTTRMITKQRHKVMKTGTL